MTHGPSRLAPLIRSAPRACPPHLPPRAALLLLLSVALAAACGPTVSPPTPSLTSPPTSGPASPRPPAASPASPTPSSSPGTAASCAVASQTARLPSDRLVNVSVGSDATSDVVTFQFGDPSLPGPPTAPEVTLEAAAPPYSLAPSGTPIDVAGSQVALVRFVGMSITNDVGQPVYDGTLEFRPELEALRHVVNMDRSEGVIGWYIGYEGTGCLTLTSDGRNVRIAVEHPGP